MVLNLLQRSVSEIRNTLLGDEVIRKLVFQDSNNALNMLPPAPEEVEDYITVAPIYEFQDKSNLARNTMINIYVAEWQSDEDIASGSGVIRVNVVCNVDHWRLVDNKIRPLALADRVIELLEGKKFSISNPLHFDTLEELIITKQMTGYALIFTATDGSGTPDNY